MANERLRGVLASNGTTLDDLAIAVGVDRKTVERWITKERLPHRQTRTAVARFLQAKETYLWPALADDPRSRSASRAELVEFYPSRSAVPVELWSALVEGAKECIDLLAYAALFLPEHVDLVSRLIRNARDPPGTRCRCSTGDCDAGAPRTCVLTSTVSSARNTVAYRVVPCTRTSTPGTTAWCTAPGSASATRVFDHYTASFDRVWAGAV